MLYGGHVKRLSDIGSLQSLGFDFGEVILRDADSLAFWRSSGVKNRFDGPFFLVSHGPFEGPPNDIEHLSRSYLPALKESVDVSKVMEIGFLTVHLWMDKRFVKPDALEPKKELLRELVDYARGKGIEIGLENLSEPAADLKPLVLEIPGLGITLDVGHAQLITQENRSFEIIEQLGHFIRHVHLHDNRGGSGPKDDLHLPIGQGIIDFAAILAALIKSGYSRTVTLELEHEVLRTSKARIELLAGETSSLSGTRNST